MSKPAPLFLPSCNSLLTFKSDYFQIQGMYYFFSIDMYGMCFFLDLYIMKCGS